MKYLKIRVTTFEPMLGTASANPEIHEEYIASKAQDALKIEEEVEAIGPEGVFEKDMTVFPRDEDGHQILWDYQMKGFFKDTCGGLRRASDYKSATLKAYKKVIDKLIFVFPRKIRIHFEDSADTCQRPLRASTAQGERIALASSEEIPAGATMTMVIAMFNSHDEEYVREWLEYGRYSGLGQWRNSGKGRFRYELLHEWTGKEGDETLYGFEDEAV